MRHVKYWSARRPERRPRHEGARDRRDDRGGVAAVGREHPARSAVLVMGLYPHEEGERPRFLRAVGDDPEAEQAEALYAGYPGRAGSYRGPAPLDQMPGLIAIDAALSPAVVINASSPRIALHPDFAEQLGLELIRRAQAARMASS